MIFLCLKEHTSHHFPSPVGVSMVTPVVNHILPKTSNAHKTPSTPKEMALKSISWDDLLQKSGHFHVQKSKLYPAFTGKQIQNFFDLFYNFYIIQSLQILKQKTKNIDLPGIIHFKHLFMHFTILIVSTTFLPSSLC